MAIRIGGVKSSHLSDDRKEVVVAATGKYTGDLELRFARECLDDLIGALTRAREAAQPTSAAATVPTVAAPAVPKPNGAHGNSNPDEVRFEIPKNLTITADTSGRGLVLFILNHRLDRQAGYAFSPDAAKQLAGGLIKSSDALLSLEQAATSKN